MADPRPTLDRIADDDGYAMDDDAPFQSPVSAEAVRETAREANATAAIAAASSTRAGRFRHILPSRSGKLITGVVIVGLITLFGIFGPMIAQPPRDSSNEALQPPSAEHW